MLDHISIGVKNFEESRKFYDETLAILGYERVMDLEGDDYKVAAYGTSGRPNLWIGVKTILTEEDLQEKVGQAAGFHVGFVAPDVESVHQWYDKCLLLGGKDNGKPGPRPEYHPGYYGAFIIDPSGWRIEACVHNYQGQ